MCHGSDLGVGVEEAADFFLLVSAVTQINPWILGLAPKSFRTQRGALDVAGMVLVRIRARAFCCCLSMGHLLRRLRPEGVYGQQLLVRSLWGVVQRLGATAH